MIGSDNLSAWFPTWASTFAPHVDMVFYDLYFMGLIALILTVGLALVFQLTFRRGEADPAQLPAGSLNKTLLGGWVLVAVLYAGFIFTTGLHGYVDQQVAPYGSYEVDVTAREGAWDFTYPGGFVADTLRVPTGRPVKLSLTTNDISRELAVPALRVNQTILPGRTTETWFTATQADSYPLYVGSFSSVNHDSLPTTLIALTEPDFEAWLAAVQDIFAGRTMAEVGELLYNTQGCKACHLLDGTKLVGPSFKNIYGYEVRTTDGRSVLVDDDYIKESLLSPNASIVEGFQGVMPSFQGKLGDKEIQAVVAFLKNLSDRGGSGDQEEK